MTNPLPEILRCAQDDSSAEVHASGAIPCGQDISKKGKEENRVGKTGGRRGAIPGAQGDGSTPQAGAIHCAPTLFEMYCPLWSPSGGRFYALTSHLAVS
jgi:hypothetical protein